MENLLRVIKALADRNRLRIIKMLQRKPMCVCELTHVLGISQPSVSRHLRVLRDAGLVRDEKEGMWINYVLITDSGDATVSAQLALLENRLDDDPQVTADRDKAAGADRMKIMCGGGTKGAS